MPRFSDAFANSVVYIYSSMDDARKGERQRGSGFIVALPTVQQHGRWLYVVTNHHVILATPTPVVRLNCKGDEVHCLQTVRKDWTPHPHGDDVAVWPLLMEDSQWDQAEYNFVEIASFVSQKLIFEEDIGVGDDVVLIGRFIGHDGMLRNAPALRFGNMALSSVQKIKSDYGLLQDSFLVEMHSLPGYSGSAVFVYSPFSNGEMSQRRFGKNRKDYDFDLFKGEVPDLKFMQSKGPYLLGVDWCSHVMDQNLPVRTTPAGQVSQKVWGYTFLYVLASPSRVRPRFGECLACRRRCGRALIRCRVS